jgi:hypothetical protein
MAYEAILHIEPTLLVTTESLEGYRFEPLCCRAISQSSARLDEVPTEGGFGSSTVAIAGLIGMSPPISRRGQDRPSIRTSYGTSSPRERAVSPNGGRGSSASGSGEQ